ncbi:asparaginase [Zhihengliuella flava]|uniref:L-asparaginase II n=1 Tax=Zhihengliuella flava TaxID=1285193 RepID=A0A931DC74_9MICC|nr:asparaginase [Zhihengliuella flava]MBG6084188.1 L-asparaginase II [Zhihengliuella flava]
MPTLGTFTTADAADLAYVDRNGFIESRHLGSAAVVSPTGDVVLELGDTTTPVFPRSSLKPFQALASMQSGAPLVGDQVALACASHVGSAEHMAVAERMLEAAGLSEADLRCPTAWPQHGPTRTALTRGELTVGSRPLPAEKSRLAFNCSGKHAAFLWACVENGWDTATYLDPDHPLQQAVVSVIEEYSAEKIAHLAIDGCGAPVPAISLRGLARAVGTLSAAPSDKSSNARAATIATAMLDYPWAVHGHGEENTIVMEDLGLIAKLGAEGVLIVGAPDGTACAVKVLDGNGRAATLVGLTLMAAAGVVDPNALGPVLAKTQKPILGGGEPVGTIRLAADVMELLD